MFQNVKKNSARLSAPSEVAPTSAVERGPFRIQVVAERAGVPAATLRAWERRYGVPSPARTTSSYRLYSVEDIERVRSMRQLCEGGMSASEAAKLVLATHPVLQPSPPSGDVLDEVKQRILRAADDFDSERLDAELLRLAFSGDAITVHERVVSPLLVEVGHSWAEGSLNVAQEHFLSERLEAMLRNALTFLRPAAGEPVFLACVSGEHHVLGLLGAALKLAGSGASPTLLGADTPPEAIAEVVARRRPRLVGLSVTRVPARPKTLFEAYSAAMDGVPWMVGGEAAAELGPIVESAGGHVAHADWHELALQLLGPARTTRKEHR